ncbi:S8 family peptidase [Streptomyces sp. NPDC093516]|uniref:S8 family peptidase n=1 Tax=Streptomyces sp. NPDC093516 TaxID=3155304 RepID=UPI003426438E
MTRHRTAALLLGISTLAGLAITPADAAPQEHTSARPGRTATGPLEKITLITGDTVSYRRTGDTVEVVGTVGARPRRGTAFARFTEKGHTYVIPQDAWNAVARGDVDRALFDITELAEQRLDDRHTDHIGVIVTGTPGAAPKTATPSTAEVTRTLPRLGMRAMSTGKADATALWKALTGEKGNSRGKSGGAGARSAAPAHGTKIWLDAPVRSTLDVSVPLVGAPTAWEHGYTGKGVKVAVLDTGIYSAHPDLKGKIDKAKDFTDSADTGDRQGHGTHVASTITGDGASSGGRYKGVAPGVRLLNGKVLDDSGRGSDSGVLAGMEWAAQQGAKVISMSLGSSYPTDGTDPLSTAVNELSAKTGALFVVAAGNEGTTESVSSPGSADAALTVASTTKQDKLSSFSSQGPRIGDFGLKPEIAAPGEDITAARAPGAFPALPGDKNYVTLSGTSMATPHVAGAAAILAGEHPDWSGQQIKSALIGSAKTLQGINVFADGAGRLDVARATSQSVRALTPTLGFGHLTWPHDPAKPTTAQVTYANDGDAPVTLALGLAVTSPKGAPAPDGLFSAPASLTVPAHGKASATVRITAGSNSVGSWTGRLTATAGNTRVVTPLAADVVDHTGSLTVRVLDRSGTALPGSDALLMLQNETTGNVYFPSGDGDSVTAEVPVGTYRLMGLGLATESVRTTTIYVARDGLRIEGEQTVTLDGREAKPMRAELNDPDARPDVFTENVTLRSHVIGSSQDSDFRFVSNYPDRYVLSPKDIPGVSFSYSAGWAPPHNQVTTVGKNPFEVGDVQDPLPSGYEGDVTTRLVDIGEETDPARIGDVKDKVVLVAPDVTAEPTEPPTPEQFKAVVDALKAKGAALVLSYDNLGDTGALPVLYLIRAEDIQGLRDRVSAGQDEVHVVGRPVSPTAYGLYDSVGAALPDGKIWHFDRTAMARVDATYRNATGQRHITTESLILTDPETGITQSVDTYPMLPQTRAEYFTPGVLWHAELYQGVNRDWSNGVTEVSAVKRYTAGQHTTDQWNAGPFTPRLPNLVPVGRDGTPRPTVHRKGNQLVTRIPVFGSANPNHLNTPGTDETGLGTDHGTTELFQGSTKVGSNGTPGVGAFTLPAAPGTYRLVVTGNRSSVLSTKVRSEWTFTSGPTEGTVPTASDLLDLGLDLPLDENTTAPAGRPLTGSVTVRHQPGASGTSPVRKVTVDVSYDEGVTWSPASVKTAGEGVWTLVIPAGGRSGGYVTLRASAAVTAGDMVRQTVTRAYGLR